ncbi:MAG: 50S ribosomal protein L22 [Catonella sp.]|nr:50S ribosomal protein L22 [Catonella sp.]MDY6357483.1 50S ribosomal protein L22 [Catonella sp.]
MAKGHRTQVKSQRNRDNREMRPYAKLSYARVSTQKACFVLDAIRGKDVDTALAILAYNPRYASEVIEKLVKSAVANAEVKGYDPSNLYIEECFAGDGPIMKRIQPRARGTAYRIFKRMSNITVILNEKN